MTLDPMAVKFLAFGIVCLIAGVLIGRLTKRSRKVIDDLGFTRGAKGRFTKALHG